MFNYCLTQLFQKERVEKMIIDGITVKGFRNIKNTKLVLDNMVALVSQNSFGKSNLLIAINFGMDFIRNKEKEKKVMMGWSKGVPLNKAMDKDDYSIEFEMTTSVKQTTYKVVYGYQFRWLRDDKTGARIVGEWFKIKSDKKNSKFKYYINRNEDKAYYRTSESGRCNNKINITESELVINKLNAYDSLKYIDIVNMINNLNMYIEKNLDASELFEHPFIREDMETLQIGSAAIPRIIYYLKKDDPGKYELLMDSFKLLFPTITHISVEKIESSIKHDMSLPEDVPLKIDDQSYFLQVIDVNINQPINFDNLSDGAKRVFLILTNILLSDRSGYSIIAIEEPENSVHPGLLQKYLRVISQFAVECKIIITSHSPYIIQYIDPNSVYIGLPDDSGIAKFLRVRESNKKSMLKHASSYGVSIGDYIFELLSGSDEELDILKSYLENSNNE